MHTVADTQSQQMVSLAGQLRNPSLECNSDFGFILRMPKYTKKHNSEVFPMAFRSRQFFRGFDEKLYPLFGTPNGSKPYLRCITDHNIICPFILFRLTLNLLCTIVSLVLIHCRSNRRIHQQMGTRLNCGSQVLSDLDLDPFWVTGGPDAAWCRD